MSMIVRLFCPKCAYEVTQKKMPRAYIEVPVPVSEIKDDGEYEVRCDAGHVSAVTLDNIKFELLFELGLNALLDNYPREAISSFSSSLERFQEFYWRVVMMHFSVPTSVIESAWKSMSRQSERQLSAYASASIVLTKAEPLVLNPNKETQLRNNVIHKGYVPNFEEAVAFGDAVMEIINAALEVLRNTAPKAFASTYEELSPRSTQKVTRADDDHTGTVNILTAVDARHPATGDDRRVGGVERQLSRVAHEREPHRMELVSEEEMVKKDPDRIPPNFREPRS